MSIPDPRHRNDLFDRSSIGAYLDGYAVRLGEVLGAVDRGALARAAEMIEAAAAADHRVFSVGNGGSAAIADHLCCDWTKGTHVSGHPVIDATSLTANGALYSALANDFGFDIAFARHLDIVGRAGDVLIAISSSGNSPNIIAAVEKARDRGMGTVGLSGFDGGRLKEVADVAIHVDARNYGIVEDAHQSVMHIIAQYIACHRDAAGPRA
ncbi:D-sedoheptulose-7-phosphate isomerase [Sphingomonas sp.]|uniref:D-sedoheptulose-7-phosphate isomerase n=1 Tax=Sphingomonas sp. TaxID=28214 RepID=UPI003AFF6E99